MTFTILDYLEHINGGIIDSSDSLKTWLESYLEKNPHLKGKSRKRQYVDQRAYIYNILKSKTEMTLEEIGIFCGNKHHSTVLWGIKKHKEYTFTKDRIYIYNTKYLREKLKLKLLL